MKRESAFVLVALLIAGVASAQTLSVTYVQGEASVQKGASWVTLAIGDIVHQGASLKLGRDTYLELKSADSKIVLSRAGTYAVRDLLAASSVLRSSGAGKAIAASLAHLFAGTTRNQGGVSGARGADESSSEDSGWVESAADIPLKAGKTFVASGQYEKAIGEFRQALNAATGEEISEARFGLASAYSLSGNTREALNQLENFKSSGSEEWAPELVLLKAKLLVDTNAFAQSLAWLTQEGNDLSEDAQRAPTYNFLLGVSYRGVGDTANEKESLSKVLAMSADSDLGKAAAQLLLNP